jgi:hypothetical protein
MDLILADRVQVTATANTTVSFTLSGTVTGFQSFSAIGNTNTTYYSATDTSGNWEVGLGTYSTTGPTLTRTTIFSSSNSGSAVTFSGTVNVFVTYPAGKAVYQDSLGTATVPQLATSATTSTTPVLSFNASNSNYAAGATISGSYLQTLLQNKSNTAGASTNYVLSNDLGTDSTYYGEFGINSSVYSASTPSDFFSINNGIYFSGHDGDITVGSGNGFKTYMAWGTTGQSAHVINASGALGLSTNLGTTPALSGTTGYGTSGQVLTSAGSAAAPTWATPLSIGGSTTQVQYNSSGVLAGSANMTFSGTALTLANDASISGLTVGKGGGSVATNTAVGYQAINATATGTNNAAYGYQALNKITSGGNCTGVGLSALLNNTAASNLTAFGYQALQANTTALTVGGTGTVTAGGTGYTAGTYTCAQSGGGATFTTYPTVTITVSGGVVQTVTVATAGSACSTSGTITLTITGGGGTGLTFTIATASGTGNTAVGYQSLASVTTATNSTAVGYQAGNANTTGNVGAFGYGALLKNTTGNGNCAFGTIALTNNITGSSNSAFGANSLSANTASNNSGFGYFTLTNNTSGSANTVVGVSASQSNTTGANNTSVGYQSQLANTTGGTNVSVGYQSLNSNTTASNNVSVGANAFGANTTAGNLVGIGHQALGNNTTNVASLGSITSGGSGYNNNASGGPFTVTLSTTSGATFIIYPTASITVTSGVITTCTLVSAGAGASTVAATVLTATSAAMVAAGFAAGGSGLSIAPTFQSGTSNTAVGYQSLFNNTTGNNNTAHGYQAGNAVTTGSDNVFLGNASGFTTTNTTTGFQLVYIGSGSRGSAVGNQNEIAIGYNATGLGSNTTVIGNSSTTLTKAFGVIVGTNYTVATLPSASTSGVGARAFVTDALAPTFGSTVTGGSSTATPVYSDGTNWKVG